MIELGSRAGPLSHCHYLFNLKDNVGVYQEINDDDENLYDSWKYAKLWTKVGSITRSCEKKIWTVIKQAGKLS